MGAFGRDFPIAAVDTDPQLRTFSFARLPRTFDRIPVYYQPLGLERGGTKARERRSVRTTRKSVLKGKNMYTYKLKYIYYIYTYVCIIYI